MGPVRIQPVSVHDLEISSQIPVWVCSLDGRLVHLNGLAVALFDIPVNDVIGRPCHQVVAGQDLSGRQFCRPDCAARRAARAGRGLPPLRLQLRGSLTRSAPLWVFTICVTHATNGHGALLHLAFFDRLTQQIDSYLRHLADAARTREAPVPVLLRSVLTVRELDVLEHLARETHIDLAARELGIAVSTFRNHVKNIHAKLHIHSTAGVIARYVLETLGDVLLPAALSETIEPAAAPRRSRLHADRRVCPARSGITCTAEACPAAASADGALARHVQIAHALAHPTRLRLLELLSRGERRNFELAAALGLPASTVSRHLAVLTAAHLVSQRNAGTATWFASRCPHAAEFWRQLEAADAQNPPPGSTL